MSDIRRCVPLTIAVAFNLLGVLLFVRLGREGFPGDASRCFKDFVCYCEQTELAGLARQPFTIAIGYDASRLGSWGSEVRSRSRSAIVCCWHRSWRRYSSAARS